MSSGVLILFIFFDNKILRSIKNDIYKTCVGREVGRIYYLSLCQFCEQSNRRVVEISFKLGTSFKVQTLLKVYVVTKNVIVYWKSEKIKPNSSTDSVSQLNSSLVSGRREG